jgi:hypothetical protein
MAYNRTLRKEASRYFLSFEFVVYLQMKKTRRGFQGNLSLTGIKGYTGNSSAAHLHFAMQANSTDMNPETGTDRYVDRDWINPMAYF